jgi:PAS domain S-box-containing protein
MINKKAPEESDKTPLTKSAANRLMGRILSSPRGVIVLTLGFGLLIWITHALLDYFVFYKGYGTFLELLITRPPVHEIYVRFVILAYFVIFGIIISLQIAERRWVEKALRESERKYRSYIDHAPDGVFIANAQGQYIEVNPAASAITGYTHEELLTMTIQDLVPSDGQTIAREHFGRVLRTGSASGEAPFMHKDGSRRYWLVDAVQIAPERFMGFVRDVTNRVQAEAQVKHLNRVLRAIRNVNQLIAQEKDRARLIQGVCDNLVETRGYHNAWIALVADFPPKGGEGDVEGPVLSTAEGPVLSAAEGPLTAEAGLGETFAPLRERLQWGALTGCGQRALAQPGVVIIRDPISVCLDCPLAAKYAGRAAMTVRLEHGGRVYGLLAVSIPIDLADDEEEQALFKEVAGDIAFALHNIEAEEGRQRAQEALQRERDLLRLVNETSPVGITVVNCEGQITFANGRAEEVLGLTKDQITQRAYNAPVWRITDYDGNPFPDEALPFKRIIATGQAVYDVRHAIEWPDGRRVLLNINAAPLFDTVGPLKGVPSVVGMVATVEDVTERVRAERALRQERDRAQRYLDIAGVMFVALNAQGEVTLINRKGYEILGYEQEEIIGRHWFDNFLPARISDQTGMVFEKLMAGEIEPVEYYENSVLTKDGEERVIAWHNTTLRDDEGNIIGILSSGEDITERVRAEEALRESEARFRQVYEHMTMGIARVSLGFRIESANEAYCRMLGYREEELIGKHLRDITHPETVEENLRKQSQLAQGVIDHYRMEKQFVHKRGHIVHGILDANLVRDAGGNPDYFLGSVLDITKRKRMEEALRTSEKLLRNVIDADPSCIFLKDGDGKFLLVNRAMAKLHGTTSKAMVGKTDADYIDDALATSEEIERFRQDDLEVIKQKRPKVVPAESFTLSNGTLKWFQTYKVPIFIEGKGDGLLGVAVDISGRLRAEEALRDAILRQNEAIKAANVGLWDWNLITNKVHYSAEWKGQIGYAEDEIGDGFEEWQSRVHPDDLDVTLERVQRCINDTQQDYQVEFRFRHKDGSYRWILAQGSVLQDEAGRSVRMLGSHVDITEHKRAEEALRESEERFRGIFETSPIGIAIVDTVTQSFLEANSSFLQILGYSLEELQQRTVMDITPPEDWERESQIVQAYLEDALPSYVVEKRYIRKDGAIRWVRITGDVLFVDSDVPPLAIANVEDITERKRAEEALRESEQDLSLAQEIAHIGSWKYNVQTGKLNWSDELFRIYGLDPEANEVSLDHGIGMIHPDDKPSAEDAFRKALENGLPYQIEYRVIRPDGEERFVQGIGKIETDGEGDVLSVYGTGQDITARKHAEMHLEQALAEKTALVQELYHRTRNNMQVIQAMLHIYAGRIADARVAEVFREMEDRIHTMALAHQKLYESQNLSRINLREYILDLFDHLRESYRGAGGNVGGDITLIEEMEDVSVLIDTAAPCGLVLNELLSNIFKHAFPENIAGEVRINLARTSDGKIDLVVADNGVGVPDGFDFRTCKTLGIQNMIAIVEYQLRGEIAFEVNNGVICRLRFRDDLYEERV